MTFNQVLDFHSKTLSRFQFCNSCYIHHCLACYHHHIPHQALSIHHHNYLCKLNFFQTRFSIQIHIEFQLDSSHHSHQEEHDLHHHIPQNTYHRFQRVHYHILGNIVRVIQVLLYNHNLVQLNSLSYIHLHYQDCHHHINLH